jgi:hypothetical protein
MVVRNSISTFCYIGQHKVNNWTYESFINGSFIFFCHKTDEQAQNYGRTRAGNIVKKKLILMIKGTWNEYSRIKYF